MAWYLLRRCTQLQQYKVHRQNEYDYAIKKQNEAKLISKVYSLNHSAA